MTINTTKTFVIGAVVGTMFGGFLIYLYFVSNSFADAGSKAIGMVGGVGGLLTAVVYFTKTYSDYRLGIEAEKHKIMFAKCYEMRAVAIAEVHGLLIDFIDSIDALSNTARPNPKWPNQDQVQDVWNAACNVVSKAKNAYLDFDLRKSFHIQEVTLKEVEAMYKHLHEWYMTHTRLPMMEEGPERNKEIMKFVNTKFAMKERLKVLEKAYRDALGTDN